MPTSSFTLLTIRHFAIKFVDRYIEVVADAVNGDVQMLFDVVKKLEQAMKMSERCNFSYVFSTKF